MGRKNYTSKKENKDIENESYSIQMIKAEQFAQQLHQLTYPPIKVRHGIPP
jgi:hypothetical protein